MKERGIPEELVVYCLNLNPSFAGLDGTRRRAPLTPGEKAQIRNKIKKDLMAIHYDNGDDFFYEFWLTVQRQISTCNWLARCGWFPVWESMKKKALLKTKKETQSERPAHVARLMNDALKGIS